MICEFCNFEVHVMYFIAFHQEKYNVVFRLKRKLLLNKNIGDAWSDTFRP